MNDREMWRERVRDIQASNIFIYRWLEQMSLSNGSMQNDIHTHTHTHTYIYIYIYIYIYPLSPSAGKIDSGHPLLLTFSTRSFFVEDQKEEQGKLSVSQRKG